MGAFEGATVADPCVSLMKDTERETGTKVRDIVTMVSWHGNSKDTEGEAAYCETKPKRSSRVERGASPHNNNIAVLVESSSV